MKSKYTFLNLAFDVLSDAKKPLTANEIWEHAVNMGLDKKINSSGKTPWQSIGAQLYTDIKKDTNSKFKSLYNDGRRFFLSDIKYPLNVSDDEQDIELSKPKKYKFIERDLHPLLVKFAFSKLEFECYCKTIYHETTISNRLGSTEWLHPDIVGVHFPFEDYDKEVRKLQDSLNVNYYKLYSFEMKTELTMSTLRKYYFQAVSNSSWANEGYLVVLNLKKDDELISELKRLNNAFGIGVIHLNAKCIEESEILFAAKEKDTVDWDTVNRLAVKNKDFNDFILNINEDIKLGKPKSNYDVVLGEDDYKSYIQDKGIRNIDK